MAMVEGVSSNFAHLTVHDEQLVRLGLLAERYFSEDPNTSLLKQRQLGELLAQLVATRVGLYTSRDEGQLDLLRRLQDQGILPREVAQLFHELRRTGNAANHAITGDHRTALATLKITWQLGVWFHRTFSDPTFKSGPFLPPRPPQATNDESEELRAELAVLNRTLAEHQAAHQDAAERLAVTEAKLREAKDEQTFWEQMAIEAEQAKVALVEKLAAEQARAEAQPKTAVTALVNAATKAAHAVELDEADTRRIIDGQLREAGWTVDSATLTFGKGARPEKHKNLAIAEWPTEGGRADYVLFVGLMPVAAIEAKRKNIDVSSALQQAKRYSRTFKATPELVSPGGPWEEFRLPFVFSANGRPYLRQLATRSGIWFCDVRDAKNLGRALDSWYSPDGLKELLKRDEAAAHAKLESTPFKFGFPLRDYQQAAIQAAEEGIAEGKREILLAMATGTGKTKTCIALIYRLLKAQRFRRVLFLVDRTTLGKQAAGSFKETRMEGLATFSEVFGIMEIDDQKPETATAVHIATVQGLVQRVLNAADGVRPPPVDQYDCIVVDECHRGYLLDREMSDTELGFRSFEDYISKYRRVLDYFDAVKIGLTATPALHTSQIFGPPIYTYGYREAVIDGHLVDYEPPIRLTTELSKNGIVWKVGEQVAVYNAKAPKSQLELFNTPDEIHIDVEEFNRRVITEPFNRVICSHLATELDPSSRQKTLIFCVNDAHADLVVKLLKEAFAERYGGVEDDAVLKITGAADQPLALFRRYQTDPKPNVAVTVDLLTTGIDVPAICNLVFLRQVNSRILFEQMLGRATRRCDEIGKETFRVFDAVNVFGIVGEVSDMKPVVVNPKWSFERLIAELGEVKTDDERTLVRDQLVAKLQAKKRHLGTQQKAEFETVAGMAPDAFVAALRTMPLSDVASWFKGHPDLAKILDRRESEAAPPIYVSSHPDKLLSVERGYGEAKKPEDYLKEFSDFIRSQGNVLPALTAVLTRPRELTRKQLRELALELDRAGFSEASLATAWRDMTNQDIAARIIGFIRQAAVGDALMPYEQRVDRALQKILNSKPWTTPQRQWLQAIASQTKTNLIVDRDALEDPDQVFRREGGGFTRLDRIFGGELQQILDAFNDSLWPASA